MGYQSRRQLRRPSANTYATSARGCPQKERNSAYDLAVVIIDECSRVFFDRAIVTTQQPQVLEIFAKAIGAVVSTNILACQSHAQKLQTIKQIISFENFLQYTRRFSESIKSKHKRKPGFKDPWTLNINVEVKLLQEIKDIIHELRVMINIMEEQFSVTKAFEGHLRRAIKYSTGSTTEPSDSRDPNWKEDRIRPETLTNASKLVKSIEERIAELKRIENTRKGASSEVGGGRVCWVEILLTNREQIA
jgi:hypothetical protein